MTIRVGFLGGGFIAHYHGKMLHRSGADATIAWVHDPDEAKAQAFAAASGAAVAPSVEAVIEASDAVYVTTWTSEHPRLVAAVAAAGKPVFCEKPLAVDLAGVQTMVEGIERSGVINQVGLVLRDSPAFLFLKHRIEQPESGRVMSVVFRDDQYIPIQGMYGSSWRGDPGRAGSGTLLEHSIHDLDLLEWIFGRVVSCNGRSREFHGIDGIEDVSVATLAFEGGGIGTLTSVWHDVLARPSLRRVEVFCERAFYVLEGDVDGPVHWTVERPGHPDGADQGSIEGAALLAHLDDLGIAPRNPDGAFIDSVIAGQPAYPGFADALRAHVLAEAVYRSSATGTTGGGTVDIPAGNPGPDWV